MPAKLLAVKAVKVLLRGIVLWDKKTNCWFLASSGGTYGFQTIERMLVMFGFSA